LTALVADLEAKEEALRPGGDPGEDLARVVADAEAAMETARKAHTDALIAMRTAQVRRDSGNDLVRKLQLTDDCPLGGDLKCSADRSVMIAAVKQDIERSDRAGADAQISLEAKIKAIADAREILELARDAVLDHRKRTNDWQQARLDLRDARAELAALQGANNGGETGD
jgi:hypothetical protein